MSCADSCSLFYKKKAICVSDPCAAVGLNCRNYGASADVFDCLSWCCEKDSSTLGIFVVVVLIVVICCAFCCAFAVYRFVLRKRAQAEANGIAEDELEEKPRRERKVPNSARSQDSTFTTSSYGNDRRHKYKENSSERSRKEHDSSSQGKTHSGERHQEYHDDYSDTGYTGRSRTERDYTEGDDIPTGFLDEPTLSARTDQSTQSQTRRKRLNDSDHDFEDQYSAHSGLSQGGKKNAVWNGDADSHYFDETPRSVGSRSQRTTAVKSRNNDLFSFEDDF